MSKIGKRPLIIPEGVEAKMNGSLLSVTKEGKTLTTEIPAVIEVKISDNIINVLRKNDSKPAKEKHGLIASLIKNTLIGVSEGFKRDLTFTGTGYRVALSGTTLVLNMGYSHEVKIDVPTELEVKIVKNVITISGIDKAMVGQLAAKIREVRPPEVYKGKGIKYADENIRRKAGKTAASK